MLKATLKSLLGRKLRLLMSTFAIVLGVAFVAGSLIFSDTLGRSFTALFASTVGDVVVRPAGGRHRRRAVDGGDPCRRLVDDLRERARARPGSTATSHAFGVYVVNKDSKVVGGLGPAGDRRQLVRRAGRSRSARASRSSRARRRTAPTRWCFDERRRERVGLRHRRQVAHRRPPRDAGAADADAGRASPASPRAARSTARRSPPSTRRRRRTSSSAARTPTPTSG